jgi:hypothetical protein
VWCCRTSRYYRQTLANAGLIHDLRAEKKKTASG